MSTLRMTLIINRSDEIRKNYFWLYLNMLIVITENGRQWWTTLNLWHQFMNKGPVQKIFTKKSKIHPPWFCSEMSEDFKTISGLSVRRLLSSQSFFKVVRGYTKILYCCARRERLNSLSLLINNKIMIFLLKDSFLRLMSPLWGIWKILWHFFEG